MTELDDALKIVHEQMREQAAAQEKMKPFLDRQLMKVQKLDYQISGLENKITFFEKKKQEELSKMNDLLELAMVDSHELKNGYKVRPDNRYKIEVTDIREFLLWLKTNCEPREVLDFFVDSLKITKLKKFCEKEANLQRMRGEMEPKIAGVIFGEVSFRRLTTEKKK